MALLLEFDSIVTQFAQAKLRYAVVGGLAVGLHGNMRATEDIDFLIHDEDLPKAATSLSQLGYHANADSLEFPRSGLSLRRFFKRLPNEEELMVVDILIPASVKMKKILERAMALPYRGDSIRVITARDLVTMKTLRSSPIDKIEHQISQNEKMMQNPKSASAERVIKKISEMRDLGRQLLLAGFRAGLHNHDPNQVPPFKTPKERPIRRRRRYQRVGTQ